MIRLLAPALSLLQWRRITPLRNMSPDNPTWLMLMQGLLAIEGGIDITNPATLEAQLWRGVTQVVCAVGPVFGRTPDGNMGYC